MSKHEHPHHGHSSHGNPEDLESYLERMLDPSRDEWQRPDEVLAALGLREGQTVAELGSGPGYLTLRLARAVGEAGRVYAVEVEPRILGALRDRIERSGLRNITPVLGLPGDPLLPPGSCDLVLAVNAFHHFPEPAAFLRRLAGCLRPGGRLANIDFHNRETPVGPPVEQRVAREQFLEYAKEARLSVTAEPTFLPHQYFVLLQPAT